MRSGPGCSLLGRPSLSPVLRAGSTARAGLSLGCEELGSFFNCILEGRLGYVLSQPFLCTSYFVSNKFKLSMPEKFGLCCIFGHILSWSVVAVAQATSFQFPGVRTVYVTVSFELGLNVPDFDFCPPLSVHVH